MESELESMRQYFKSGNTKDASWRLSQLKGLLLFIKENEAEIFKALKEDLGKPPVEAFRDEVGTLIKSINFALKGLKNWMSSQKIKLPKIAVSSYAELVPQPLGLVLIISTWNFPFGNTMVLKPSELAPACSSLLANVMPTYLDTQAIKVIQGGPSVGEQLLQQKWDKIFFTGSARVGRIVMSAAVKHLTPVVLELGGKCPAVVDSLSSSWDQQVAANRIVVSKFGNCTGQACIAIDYILVEKKFASTLVELMKDSIKNMFGDNPRDSNTMGRIVNKHHFLRLKNLLSDLAVKKSVVHGGSMDENNLFIEPTILLDPPLQAEIMTDEIFGPLLPIITLEKVEDSIDFINSKPKALAIYAFTKNEPFRRRMVAETSSGSLVFNDAVIQYLVDALPFGGIGESGIGKYHGKFSFDTFTHHKAVARRSFLVDFWFRFPPWNVHKLMLFETAYNLDYFGLLLVILGLKKRQRNTQGI
ncbi:aldehyde dehydrogenase family 3 member F1 isoform X2 [Hevea brasiliensis]|uniref:aldehyde dehydrogenase family 3 member F1 isoform X2 n=1 Tax=Hevea brasiliensis TaxID=3981 RepID=UPI0025E77E41|nr:aldehyde dehydrogenase family 3 member F1 isoform X2 [Hevea brasiliensis]